MVGEGSIFDFSDVPPAFDESAFESLDVTFAREDDRPRVPDQAEDSRSPIHLLLRNKYFETFLLFGLSTTPPYRSPKSDRTIKQNRRRACGVTSATIYDLRYQGSPIDYATRRSYYEVIYQEVTYYEASLLGHQGDSTITSPIYYFHHDWVETPIEASPTGLSPTLSRASPILEDQEFYSY